jgi:hypothetical protein
VNGVAQALDAGDAASAHGAACATVHEKCVELDPAIAGEKGASARVEGLIVFEDGDSSFNGIDGGGATIEQGVAGEECTADAAAVGFDGVVRNGPGAAMDEENGLGWHANFSSYMGRRVSAGWAKGVWPQAQTGR